MSSRSAVVVRKALPGGVEPLAVLKGLLARPEGKAAVACLQRLGEDGLPTETVVGFDPMELIRCRGRQAIVERGGERLRLEGEPFEVVGRRLAQQRAEASGPSRGAALGYIAYDAARLLEPSLVEVPGNLQRAGADAFDAEVALFRQALVFDHRAGQVELQADPKAAAPSLDALLDVPQLMPRPLHAPVPPEQLECSLGKERFMRGVEQLKEHIRAGDIFQAVLAERFSCRFEGDPLELFVQLCAQSRSPYRFFFLIEGRAYMGTSPEMLLSVRGDELETHPIAGTRRRGATADEERALEAELLASEKERAEHLMLVDLARNDVGRVSQPGSVRVRDFMQVQKFGGVMHLVSRVTGERTPGTEAMTALAHCFPAGTLSGAPKIKAMQLLSGLEPVPRGFYGGAFISASLDGDLESCIAIRCIEVGEGRAVVQAGAGVVADSTPEGEYDEVLHKTSSTRAALGAFV